MGSLTKERIRNQQHKIIMSLLKQNIQLKRENKKLKQTFKSQKENFENIHLQSKQSKEGLAQKDKELKKWKSDYVALKKETIPLHTHHQTLKLVKEQSCQILLDLEGRIERLRKKQKELTEHLDEKKKNIEGLKEDKGHMMIITQ